jgi:hypothetical protein
MVASATLSPIFGSFTSNFAIDFFLDLQIYKKLKGIKI